MSITETNDTVTLRWEKLEAGQDGGSIPQVRTGSRVVQVFGTFGGATLLVEGSVDQENWFQLRDPTGLPLRFTSPDGKAILESPPYLRARVLSGDTSTSISALISIRKS